VFWVRHLHRADVLVCGLIVHADGTLLIVFAARNRYLIHRISYTAPVLDIQHKVADLRAFRMRAETRPLLAASSGFPCCG
jgi:hypothetical protein